eukprot:TRINITY_DN1545_c0_g1_i1.p1 TRINITY_DN1545_c0_g1~~TRINITY_DN1545_c0_g1_i1.p1  ORF type:complete len:423 (-),score=96.00 TRINITY_DN1545_c0_g1_i1:355-1623(-)
MTDHFRLLLANSMQYENDDQLIQGFKKINDYFDSNEHASTLFTYDHVSKYFEYIEQYFTNIEVMRVVLTLLSKISASDGCTEVIKPEFFDFFIQHSRIFRYSDVLGECLFFVLSNLFGEGKEISQRFCSEDLIRNMVEFLLVTKKKRNIDTILWCISNFCRNEFNTSNFVLIEMCMDGILPFLLSDSEEEKYLTLWTMQYCFQRSCDQNMSKYMTKNFIENLFFIIEENSTEKLLSPALRVIGNYLCNLSGRSFLITCLHDDLNIFDMFVDVFKKLYQKKQKRLIKEIIWTVSNIVCEEPLHQYCFSNELMSLILNYGLETEDVSVEIEVTFVLANAIHVKTDFAEKFFAINLSKIQNFILKAFVCRKVRNLRVLLELISKLERLNMNNDFIIQQTAFCLEHEDETVNNYAKLILDIHSKHC